MIIEKYRNGDPVPVYRRFRDQGRLAPDDLFYISSWVNETMTICYQVMETDDPLLINKWMDNWKDIVEFEFFPVIKSSEVFDKISSLL